MAVRSLALIAVSLALTRDPFRTNGLNERANGVADGRGLGIGGSAIHTGFPLINWMRPGGLQSGGGGGNWKGIGTMHAYLKKSHASPAKQLGPFV